jgi:hypothetical protein
MKPFRPEGSRFSVKGQSDVHDDMSIARIGRDIEGPRQSGQSSNGSPGDDIMKTLISAAAVFALLAGISVVNAQVGGVPAGTGPDSNVQDQRASEQEKNAGPWVAPRGQEMESDTRAGSNTDGNGTAQTPPAGDNRSNGPRH